MMLILPTHEHFVCLQLFESSSVSYNFLSVGPLYLWLDLFLFLILFKGLVNEIVFLISFSVISLMAYKNATDFWILILMAITLLSSLLSSSSFLVEALGFSVYRIMSSINLDGHRGKA